MGRRRGLIVITDEVICKSVFLHGVWLLKFNLGAWLLYVSQFSLMILVI
jgi:hypothetical protein